MDRTNVVLDSSQLIGPGYMDRSGILSFTGPDPLNMGGFRIANLEDPITDSDAATRSYVDVQELSNLRVDTSSSPARSFNDLLVYNGTKWVNGETITTGDIQTSLSGKNLALNIKAGAILNVDVNTNAGIEQSKLNMSDATVRENATGITQANKGLASFDWTQFTSTNGFIKLQTTSSTVFTGIINGTTLTANAPSTGSLAVGQVVTGSGVSSGTRITAFASGTGGAGTYTVNINQNVSSTTLTAIVTGVALDNIQQIGTGSVLGNRSGASRTPYEITPGQVVTDGDGIKNASFAPGSVGTDGRAMILTALTPNTYSTINISTTGQASSLIKSDGSGVVDVAQLEVDGYKTLDTSGTTLEMFTPGGVKFMTASGNTDALSTITTIGTLSVNAITSAAAATFSPANANVVLSPTGTGTVTVAPASTGTINNVNIGGTTRGSGAFTTLTANNSVTFTQNAASTNTTSGTVVVTGGVGISGNLHVGGTITGSLSGTASNITGQANSATITATTSATGDRIVLRDSNGDTNARYSNATYFNSTDDTSTAAAITGIIAKKGDDYHRTASSQQVATFLSGSTINSLTIGTQLALNANTSIRQSTGGSWTGDTAAGTGKLEYHSNRWYVNVGSDSTEVVRFRRGNTDVSWIDNAGVYNGTATSARYADLAENYQADSQYEPGTVLVFGGANEVTVTNTKGDTRVAGVVSTNPAHLMNADLTGENVVALGLTGRVPCKVVGKVSKGDILVTSAKPGYAMVNNTPVPGTIVGKAVENKDDFNEGVIEVVVGRF
jgi:hypothetical protein